MIVSLHSESRSSNVIYGGMLAALPSVVTRFRGDPATWRKCGDVGKHFIHYFIHCCAALAGLGFITTDYILDVILVAGLSLYQPTFPVFERLFSHMLV